MPYTSYLKLKDFGNKVVLKDLDEHLSFHVSGFGCKKPKKTTYNLVHVVDFPFIVTNKVLVIGLEKPFRIVFIRPTVLIIIFLILAILEIFEKPTL